MPEIKIIGKKIKTPKEFGSYDLRFFKNGQEIFGYGYIQKWTGLVGLIKCPKCMRENYSMAVNSGQCSWCGFNANKIKIT